MSLSEAEDPIELIRQSGADPEAAARRPQVHSGVL
jgi:hypothetical protein